MYKIVEKVKQTRDIITIDNINNMDWIACKSADNDEAYLLVQSQDQSSFYWVHAFDLMINCSEVFDSIKAAIKHMLKRDDMKIYGTEDCVEYYKWLSKVADK